MVLHVIACRVLTREISTLAARSPNTLQLHFVDQEFHDQPEKLRSRIQSEIDLIDQAATAPADDSNPNNTRVSTSAERAEGIILAYGLCSNAICRIRSQVLPLIAPRAHDCVALILGSRHRYQEYFDEHPGTYWFTPGWIEQTEMPGRERVARLRERYREAYGEENADYLMDMEQQWLRNYNRCTYVSWPELDREEYRSATHDSASFLEWEFDEMPGDPDLLQKLLDGQWNDSDVVIVPPGATIEPSYTSDIIETSE